MYKFKNLKAMTDRMSRLMGWSESDNHMFEIVRRIGKGEATVISLEKGNQICDRIEELERETTKMKAALQAVRESYGGEAMTDIEKKMLKLSGVELIAAERQRQIDKEGFTPEHDDNCHNEYILVRAALYYAFTGTRRGTLLKTVNGLEDSAMTKFFDHAISVLDMPEWGLKSYGPKRDLIRAGALIAAALDYLNRKQGSSNANK